MSSLFEKDLDQLIAKGDEPLVPSRPQSPSTASLFLHKWTPKCSSIRPRNDIPDVVECPSTMEMLCTQCNAFGANIRVVVDRETGTTYFICAAAGCFGLTFARWSEHDHKVQTWSGVYLESRPNVRVHGPTNRIIQLKVLDLNDAYFIQSLHHNSEFISFADLPDMLVNNRLAFGGPKAIELRRRVRKTEYRWLAFTPSAGEFYIGKEKKLLFRIVNSTVPTAFRLTATDEYDLLSAGANKVPTDTEDDVPTASKPTRHIAAARKKPGVIPPSAAAVTSPSTASASKTASVKTREVIDLTLSDSDEPSSSTVVKKISPVMLVVDADEEAPVLVSAGQKRKRDDVVVGKEKKARTERAERKSKVVLHKGKENLTIL